MGIRSERRPGYPTVAVGADGTVLMASAASPDGITWTTGSSAATASSLAQRDAQANLSADSFIPGFTTTATAAGTTTLTVDSTQEQEFTGSTTQTVLLPTTGIVAGQSFTIINQSTSSVTVQSSGANTIAVLPGLSTAIFKARVPAPTTAANWTFQFTPPVLLDKGVGINTAAQRTSIGTLLAISFIPSTTTTATAATTTTLVATSSGMQVFTGSTTQILALPTTTITTGQSYLVINTSTGAITINSSAGNLVKTLDGGQCTVVTALVNTPTTAAHWYATNGRTTARVLVTTQAAVPTFNTDLADVISITGLAQAITSMTTNQTGTPVAGDTLKIQITDNGSPRAITWGTKFEAPLYLALPTTTINNIMLTADFVWNTVSSKWRLLRTDWDPRSLTAVPRTLTTTSAGTLTLDASMADQYNVTALAVDITAVTITNPSDGQHVFFRFKDNGTPRNVTWGSSFVAGAAPLLTTTIAGLTHLTEFVYDAVLTKWVCTLADLNGGTAAAGSLIVANTQTASYTLVLGDASKGAVEMNVASANNLTIPLNSSVAFPIGTVIELFQLGAGQTTVVATGGVTIRSSGSKLKLTGQYSGAGLRKRATDEWVLIGDIAT